MHNKRPIYAKLDLFGIAWIILVPTFYPYMDQKLGYQFKLSPSIFIQIQECLKADETK